MKSIVHSVGLAGVLLLSSCSSHIPPEIRQGIDGSPSVAQVHQATDAYLSQKVRWGGVILNIENKQNDSWLTILAYPLSDKGEPQRSAKSQGRFIAIVDKFLEPLVYTSDRKITVTGTILRTETIKVGEFPYQYPVVQVEHLYLWAPDPEPSDFNYPPYWYDPWYDPWYNPWYNPYYPHHYYP